MWGNESFAEWWWMMLCVRSSGYVLFEHTFVCKLLVQSAQIPSYQSKHVPWIYFLRLFGPSIFATSFLLNCSIPLLNRPTIGVPILRCLFPSLFDFRFVVGTSRIIPFCWASFLRLSSLSSAFWAIPFRCAIGIFFCARSDDFEPTPWRRRSRDLCLFCTDRDKGERGSKRWDSFSRRWRAMSFLRLASSAAASLGLLGSLCFWLGEANVVLQDGGREDF